jgi:uncharacterized protein YhbP (UPF0306 family)
MKEIKELIGDYLNKTRMLQIATSDGNQPWCCTLYYAYDDDWNIYWLSLPSSRHSEEIMKNPNVAGGIAFSQEPYPEGGVRGLSFEGKAELLSGDEEKKACQLYITQLMREETLLEDIRSGKNPHKFYHVKPTLFVLFDRLNFPDNPRQEYSVNS